MNIIQIKNGGENMINFKEGTKLGLYLALIITAIIATPVHATSLTLNTGTPIIAIDGDQDSDSFVEIVSIAFVPYDYGYFLNGSSIFTSIDALDLASFNGGDVIDFALYDGTTYYSLSGDTADDSYSVVMTFGNQVTVGSSQQPADWSPKPYYYNANITWTLPEAIINTNELALNFDGNDGVAPVPEPSILLLLGSGLIGFGFFGRNRRKD